MSPRGGVVTGMVLGCAVLLLGLGMWRMVEGDWTGAGIEWVAAAIVTGVAR